MLKAVIFDLDGTLVDSVSLHAQAWQVAFKEHGYYIPYEQLLDTPTAEARGILGSLRSQSFTTSWSEPSL